MLKPKQERMDYPVDMLRLGSSDHIVSRLTAFYDFLLHHLLDHPLNLRHERLWVEKRDLAAAVSQLQSYFVPA